MNEITVFDKIYNIIVEETNLKILHEKLLEYHPFDIANVFTELDITHRQKIYKSLGNKELSYLFSYLELDEVILYLNELKPSKIAAILEEMEVDDATDIIKEMDNSEQVQMYLKMISTEARDEINDLSAYKEDVVGSLMTTNYIKINSNIDVKEAMKVLISEADETEIIDPIYVSDNNRLVGILNLKDLIIARSPKLINEIMKTNFISVDVFEDTVDAVRKMHNYGIKTLPVLKYEKQVGIITIDDAIDVIRDEATFNYGHLAGVVSDIDEEASVFKSLFKRLPWLLILLVMILLVSIVISSFEGVIKQVTVLVFFQTLILGMAGNFGTQSLAVTIRGISRNDYPNNKQLQKHFFKELRIIFINTIICSLIAFIVCYVFLYFKNPENINIILVALVVSLSMSITLIISGLIGVLMPIFFDKIKIDPAVASGPFVTTIIDIASIVVYFNIASLLLNLS